MSRSSLFLVWAAALGAGAPGCADTNEPAADTGDGSDTASDDPSADDGPSTQPTAPDDDGPGSSGTASTDGADSVDSGDAESSTGGEPLPPDPCIEANTCPPGEWIDVTPAELAPLEFGPGPVVVDPGHPSDLYMGGGGDGLWKSSDYGNTWTQINAEIGYVPMGLILAVAGTEPATLWVAGYNVVHKSTDGGVTFEPIAMEGLPAELYSIEIDPYDDDHLVSGIHEADGLAESFDGGLTWEIVEGTGFPAGGKSWYPFFLDTGDAKTTRGTWFAIAQDGGSATITTDGGASWTIPPGIEGLQHAHGNAQIFQHGMDIFAGGVAGPGAGVYRSTDMGASFERVADGNVGVVWGSDDAVYSMWGWACSECDLGAGFMTAPLPGDDWSMPPVPAELIIGANHIAVTSDGTHDVFVGTMWSEGVWRYVEP